MAGRYQSLTRATRSSVREGERLGTKFDFADFAIRYGLNSKSTTYFMRFEGQHYSSKLSFGVAVVLKESKRGRSLFCMIMSVALACSSIRHIMHFGLL